MFESLHAREPASFWRENEIAVVILQQGLARMSASYPDVSLDVRAKEGGKETSVPFPWSLAVYHQSLVSRSPLPCEKRSA